MEYNKIMNIAEYKSGAGFYQRTVESLANKDQKLSYKYIVDKINHNEYVSISDNDYLDVYLHELNKKLIHSIRNKDVKSISEVAEILDFVIEHYESTHVDSVRRYYPTYIFSLRSAGKTILGALDRWMGFLYENGWSTNSNDVIISLYTTFKGIGAQEYVDTKYFGVFATVNIRKYLTSFGSNHYDNVLAIISDLLNRDYQLLNTNYIFKMYKFEDGEISIADTTGQVGAEAFFNLYINTLARKTEYDDGIFRVRTKVPVYTPRVRDAYIKSIANEAEAILRQETGVEHRWVSESVLFRQIQSAFKNQIVKKHASPPFLGRQHYDVYMPELKVALEYQGEQHFKPIPFFGGEVGFIETQKRDKRKRKLSEDNGIHQIDVLPGYDIAAVLEKILHHNDTYEYVLDDLILSARTLNTDMTDTLESRESAVARINLDHEVTTSADDELEEIIKKLIRETSNTKIGQRELTTEAILRYQGLCLKYMRKGEQEKELQVRIMMYARGVKSYSFDEYWREKELIKMIGIENYTNT